MIPSVVDAAKQIVSFCPGTLHGLAVGTERNLELNLLTCPILRSFLKSAPVRKPLSQRQTLKQVNCSQIARTSLRKSPADGQRTIDVKESSGSRAQQVNRVQIAKGSEVGEVDKPLEDTLPIQGRLRPGEN